MAKVRVPKWNRPPSRFGVIDSRAYPSSMVSGIFKVSGKYRAPKTGEFFWSSFFQKPTVACFDFGDPFVILEEVK